MSGELRFWISIFSGIPDSLSCSLYSKVKGSGFHKQNFPGFRTKSYDLHPKISLRVAAPSPPTKWGGVRLHVGYRKCAMHVLSSCTGNFLKHDCNAFLVASSPSFSLSKRHQLKQSACKENFAKVIFYFFIYCIITTPVSKFLYVALTFYHACIFTIILTKKIVGNK